MRGLPPPPVRVRIGYAATWFGAAVAVLVFLVVYRNADENDSFFNHRLHAWSAIVLFAFVILTVVASAVQKRIDCGALTRWELTYWALAAAMAGSALVVGLTGGTDTWWGRHSTFLTEAILIVLLAAFWVVQTIDRRLDDAPRY